MIHTAPTTAARGRAVANFSANKRELAATQAGLALLLADFPPNIEWVFGRDGSLTVQDANGRWWAGCSVPTEASAAMLKKMDVMAPVTCFLAPPMAAPVRVALDKLQAHQAIVVVCPDPVELAVLLGSANYSVDLAAHRLWFAAGNDWQKELDQLFEEQTGLAVPSQFLRLPMSDDKLIESLIDGARSVFARHTLSRAERLNATRDLYGEPDYRRGRLCIMCPSHFRLWNDEGSVLATIAREIDAEILDTDDPAGASPLNLTLAVCRADAFLAPNFARADLPGVVPTSLPWITWVTNGRIPRFDLSGSEDRLLVTDTTTQNAATAAGWPANCVSLAGWPAASSTRAIRAGELTVVADTFDVSTPTDMESFSSHRVLWDSIRREITDDAFSLDEDLGAYLAAQLRRYDIAADAFPSDRFINQLIVPAYQHALVRLLLESELPVRLHGRGWDEIEEFQMFAAGPVTNRAEFHAILDRASVLVHVWPGSAPHWIDSVGRTVVHQTSRRKEAFVRDARSALLGAVIWSKPPAPPITATLLKSIIAGSVSNLASSHGRPTQA